MTSQVVLVTQAGVAVASDTVVTHGDGKTLPTAEKIIAMGGRHKVVVLHSGQTAVGRVMWDLLVREWAIETLHPLPALEDYARAFQRWLMGFRAITIEEDESVAAVLEERIYMALRLLPPNVLEALRDLPQEDVPLPTEVDSEITKSLCAIEEAYKVDTYVDEDRRPYESAPLKKARDLIRRIDSASATGDEEDEETPTSIVDSAFRHHLGHLLSSSDEGPRPVPWKFSPALVDALREAAVYLIRHPFWPDDSTASLNFAGFGTDEPIGGVVQMDIAGIYLGALQARIGRRRPRLPRIQTRAYVHYIAQKEAIADFVRGLDGPRRGELLHLIEHALEEKTGDLLPADVKRQFMTLVDERVDGALWSKYEFPVMRTLESLSLTSLTHFAEALVKIQSLRSMTSRGKISVGGVIEGLSIDREHGIVWDVTSSEARRADHEHSPNWLI